MLVLFLTWYELVVVLWSTTLVGGEEGTSGNELSFKIGGRFPLGFAAISDFVNENNTLRINESSALKISALASAEPENPMSHFAAGLVSIVRGEANSLITEALFQKSAVLSNFTLSYAVYNYAFVTNDTNEAVAALLRGIERVYTDSEQESTSDAQDNNNTYQRGPIDTQWNSQTSRSFWLHDLLIRKLFATETPSRQLEALLLATDMYPENRDNWTYLVGHLLRMISLEILHKAEAAAGGDSVGKNASDPESTLISNDKTRNLMYVMARGALLYPSDPGIMYVLGILNHRLKNDICAIEFMRRCVRMRSLVETAAGKDTLMVSYLQGNPSVVAHNLAVLEEAYLRNHRVVTVDSLTGDQSVRSDQSDSGIPRPVRGQCEGLVLPFESNSTARHMHADDIFPEMFKNLDRSNMSTVTWFPLLMRKWHPMSSRIHPIDVTGTRLTHSTGILSEEERYKLWYRDYEYGNVKLQLGCNTFDCVGRGWLQADADPSAATHFKVTAYDLSLFTDASVAVIYCSHMLEHLTQNEEKMQALKEWRRVLRYGGLVLIAVPDLEVIADLLLNKSRFNTADRRILLDIIYGGQGTPYDFHKSGFTEDVLADDLKRAGFCDPQRVENDFQLFADMSNLQLANRRISLSMVAHAC